ncbi:Serine/threonine-protein phosphatase 7 inactive homolog [Durusdinium trenchii]|uniref:Serine/threonine-protein phosphatase 7 inactive homolog n=1 Tax=Durusdinium trenchii TaxID=1381693 RepID=A0ABP0M3C5_9DINO
MLDFFATKDFTILRKVKSAHLLLELLDTGGDFFTAEDMVVAMETELQALHSPVLDIHLPEAGEGRLVVVGDLHGQLQDVLHIFEEHGPPSEEVAYVFNGDIVGRAGEALQDGRRLRRGMSRQVQPLPLECFPADVQAASDLCCDREGDLSSARGALPEPLGELADVAADAAGALAAELSQPFAQRRAGERLHVDGGGGDPLRCPVGWDVPIANRAWVVLAVDGRRSRSERGKVAVMSLGAADERRATDGATGSAVSKRC